MKVVFCCPTVTRPYAPFLAALEQSTPLITDAGFESLSVYEVGNAYISNARANMLRKALDAKADLIVFLDHDLSWDAPDLLALLQTEGDVVAGTYRFKQDKEEYMGELWPSADGRPIVRADGCVRAKTIPAGFLKITALGVHKFMSGYPHLVYGRKYHPYIDLFNHGAHEGIWYGEDYAFCRNWNALENEIWTIPNLNITHWAGETPYPGNYHEYLLRTPGGSGSDNPVMPRNQLNLHQGIGVWHHHSEAYTA